MRSGRLVNARKIGAEMLQLVLDGKLSAAEARKQWPDYEEDSVLDRAFHMLYHFEDDEDIRAKDQKYAEWQVGELNKMILRLTGKKLQKNKEKGD